MKALILAAGFGTRLLPYSAHTPKPLFPINGRPLLDIMICSLEQFGCQAIMVNTHHLANEIDLFLARQSYSIPVETRYEPEILGTGGAIKNAADFFGEDPFMVVNSDIVTNLDFKKLYNFHCGHPYPVTMALCDNDQFNTVRVNREGFITDFQHHSTAPKNTRQLTFTGIQVLDPAVLGFIPFHDFSSSIDAYKKLTASGNKIKAFMPGNFFWQDIGTPDQYRRINLERLTDRAWGDASPLQPPCRGKGALSEASPDTDQTTIKLKGDGSDRCWYRITRAKKSLILADHGLRRQKAGVEVDSFIDIGRHLHDRGLPIPEILAFDRFSGLVLVEDLGNTHLQDLVNAMAHKDKAHRLYKAIIDILVTLSIEGARGFNPNWTCQSVCYDRDLILEKECRYFTDAFLNNYLNFSINFDELIEDFSQLADKTVICSCNGFMHRDLQSRNIMIKNEHPFFIDFQGGRTGPIQYDLASLLIDPYVALPLSLQARLLDYGMRRYRSAVACSREKFMAGYQYCRITRNLQMLGAFAFLSQVKHKPDFEAYIPRAVRTLAQSLTEIGDKAFPRLSGLLPEIQDRLPRTNRNPNKIEK
jgi:aminoglycoside/choline kinase family phosphotransferase/dTDP-glucose pyrophosphorylase